VRSIHSVAHILAANRQFASRSFDRLVPIWLIDT